MFLNRRKSNEAQQLIEKMEENNRRLEIAGRNREISMLQLQLAVKECLLTAMRLKGVSAWRR